LCHLRRPRALRLPRARARLARRVINVNHLGDLIRAALGDGAGPVALEFGRARPAGRARHRPRARVVGRGRLLVNHASGRDVDLAAVVRAHDAAGPRDAVGATIPSAPLGRDPGRRHRARVGILERARPTAEGPVSERCFRHPRPRAGLLDRRPVP